MNLRRIRITACATERCAAFYADMLGLPVNRLPDGSIAITAGQSTLEIVQAPAGEQPCHHFAFNIPSNLLLSAQRWLRARVPLLEVEGETLFEFASWNAHAMYFLDPAGNILELIARHDLPPARANDFSPAQIDCVSEIGVVCEDVPAAVAFLRERFALPPYTPPDREFTAVGDPFGLLIAVRCGRAWYPTQDTAASSWPMEVEIEGAPAERSPVPGTQCILSSR